MCELVSYPLILALVHIRGGHSHDHRVHLRVLNTSNTFIPCVGGLNHNHPRFPFHPQLSEN